VPIDLIVLILLFHFQNPINRYLALAPSLFYLFSSVAYFFAVNKFMFDG